MNDELLNESTLERRIGTILMNTFPTSRKLKVKQQKSFSVNFGRHKVMVDFKEPSQYNTRAIYDILLTTEDEKVNLILLELKKEGHRISEDDIEQGISYARLIHPMPPITLISNGSDNLFFNTYTKAKIDNDSVDFDFIMSLIDNSFKLALNDFKQTIETLVGRDPKIIVQVINDISASRFESISGELSDLTKPICQDFIIERELTKNLKRKTKEKNLIGIIGHAFSGKTTILYEYYKSYSNNSHAVYYLDCKKAGYSIFQHLANHLTRTLGYHIEKEKVREWLLLSLSRSENIEFVFLFDNFDNDISEAIKTEIAELVDLLTGTSHSVVFTINLISYKSISKDKYRNYKTFWGSNTHIMDINELSLGEFEKASNLIYHVSDSFFEPGAYFAIEYRHPRILRLLASFCRAECKNLPEGQGLRIIAVPDYETLEILASNNSFGHEMYGLFEKLTIAFIKDRNKKETAYMRLAAQYGGISFSTIKEVFKDETDNLLSSGFVSKYRLGDGMSIVYPKIPELIAYYGIDYITSLLVKNHENRSIEDIYLVFEKYCSPFINNDIVGARVLINIGRKRYVDLFNNLVLHLKSLDPSKSSIKDGTKALMIIDEKTSVNINFEGEGFEEGFIGNLFPYLVLSQLAGYPMRTEGSEKDEEYDFHLGLLLDIAECPYLIVRISNFSFNNLPPIKSYEFKNVGTVVCGEAGIIEPIVQSIQKCFYVIPEQIERLYNYAFENRIFQVIWRIYLAIRNEVNVVDKNISKRAQDFLKRFEKEFPDLFKEILEKNKD
jgi:hypothetical protein